MLKVKVISLPYIFQVLYVLCFTRPRYQVSVYRTIGPLVHNSGHKVKMGLTCSGIRYFHVLMTECHYLVPLRVLAYVHVFSSND